MNRCGEAGYDSQEDKRSERLWSRERSPEQGLSPTDEPAHATESRRLYAVGSTVGRSERSDLTRTR